MAVTGFVKGESREQQILEQLHAVPGEYVLRRLRAEETAELKALTEPRLIDDIDGLVVEPLPRKSAITQKLIDLLIDKEMLG